jgi:hypothetical protein
MAFLSGGHFLTGLHCKLRPNTEGVLFADPVVGLIEPFGADRWWWNMCGAGFYHGFCCVRVRAIELRLLCCARFSAGLHSRMPLVPTPARFEGAEV